MKKPPVRSALLEIGTEEIPARFIPDALSQLSKFLTDGLAQAGLEHSKLEVWGTPRRLIVSVQGLPDRAKDRTDLVIGPPPKAAKDEKGNWTQAALGFAKTQKLSVDKLVFQNTSKGERLVATHSIKGQKTDVVLKELFPSVIKSLAFPKSMIWEKEGLRFARPIRWILALLNSQVIRFKMAGIQSDRATMGLLALGGKKISIPHADRYKTMLQGRCILVNPEDRSKNIRSQMESLAKKNNAVVVIHPENLQEVINLTEYPVSIMAHFKESFLKLPREVLISSLIKHQKFFPIESNKGVLSHAFIGVRNGPSESQETVRDGYERVINARLADAQFFYEHDSKLNLEDLSKRLTEVGFIQNAGTLADKTARVQKLTGQLGATLHQEKSLVETACRVAMLAKADLLTQMVTEFPELQGIAGRFYAEGHEDKKVATGIEQHYWPLTAEGPLPKSDEAALVSVADKMDTLAAYFAVGQIPSGSADPYGLRRHGIGVIRILLGRKWEISLHQLVEMACALLPFDAATQKKASQSLTEFLQQRVFHWLGHQGYRSDEIEAVISKNGESLSTIHEKLDGLKTVRGKPEFESLAAAIKRARNILKQAQEKGFLPPTSLVNLADLEGAAEKSLHQSLDTVRPAVQFALSEKNYREALMALAPLKGPVDAFFEGVKVMVDDEKLRSQRLSLLQSVKELFDSLADFSKLQGAA